MPGLISTEQGSDPSAPGTGKRNLYAKDDGWWDMDDTGSAAKIGGAQTTEYQISPSIATNNLTVALKDIDGNNPSAASPVDQKIGGTVRSVTAALSVTVNAGTDTFNLGDPMFAALKQQLFVYLGYNTSGAAVFLGLSRMPYGKTYGDFSSTATDEDYLAISSGTPASTDPVKLIGRVDVQNSGTASYNWSLPTGAVVIHQPIFQTDVLSFVPTWTSLTVGNGTLTAQYKIDHDRLGLNVHLVWGSTSSISGAVYIAVPLISYQFNRSGGAGNDYSSVGNAAFIDAGTALYMGSVVLRETQDFLELRAINAAGTYAVWTGANTTIPHTWVSTDTIDVNAVYFIN